MGLIRNSYLRIVRRLAKSLLNEQKITSQLQLDAIISNPFARYDLQTFFLIKKILKNDSNTIDVGAHVGEVLEKMIDSAPSGQHFAFEPLPHLHKVLTKKFEHTAKVYPYALSDQDGIANFNYVVSNPYYSGLRNQQYPSDEVIEVIQVELRQLDQIIPEQIPINLIKIDVEGAEFNVLKGAVKILSKWKPVIIYEQGLGSAEYYSTTPEAFYDFMISFGYKISLMDYYILNLEPLTKGEYCNHFNKRYNYYFIAY